MEIYLVNVKISYKRITSIQFSKLYLCLLFLKNNQLKHSITYRVIESLCCARETRIIWYGNYIKKKSFKSVCQRSIFWGWNCPPTSTPVLVKALLFYHAVGIKAQGPSPNADYLVTSFSVMNKPISCLRPRSLLSPISLHEIRAT